MAPASTPGGKPPPPAQPPPATWASWLGFGGRGAAPAAGGGGGRVAGEAAGGQLGAEEWRRLEELLASQVCVHGSVSVVDVLLELLLAPLRYVA